MIYVMQLANFALVNGRIDILATVLLNDYFDIIFSGFPLHFSYWSSFILCFSFLKFRMVSSLPAEIILLCCSYLPYPDIRNLGYASSRILRILKRNLPLSIEPSLSIQSITISPTGFSEVIFCHEKDVKIYFRFEF